MKKLTLSMVSFIIIFLSIGCENNSQSSDAQTSLPKVDFASEEEVKQREEEERIRQKLRDEKKEKRVNYAISAAKQVTENFKNQVSPSYGSDLNTEVVYEESSYDYDTEKVVLIFNSSWWAYKTTMLANENKEFHKAKCRLTVYGDNQVNLEVIEMNTVLQESIEFDRNAKEVGELIDQLDKMFSK